MVPGCRSSSGIAGHGRLGPQCSQAEYRSGPGAFSIHRTTNFHISCKICGCHVPRKSRRSVWSPREGFQSGLAAQRTRSQSQLHGSADTSNSGSDRRTGLAESPGSARRRTSRTHSRFHSNSTFLLPNGSGLSCNRQRWRSTPCHRVPTPEDYRIQERPAVCWLRQALVRRQTRIG